MRMSLNSTVIYDLNSTDENSTKTLTDPLSEDQTVRNAIIISCYTLIVIVSLCGNLLVCKIAFGKKKMRTTTNMLIASLACSDIIMTAFNIPFNIARLLLPHWPFGSVLCFFVPFVQTSCVYVSTFTMTVISLHRWRTITKRSSFRAFSPIKLCAIVFFIWCFAFIFALPTAIFNRLKEVNLYGKQMIRCRVKFPEVEFDFSLFISVEIFLTQYLIPLLITCIVYIKIGCIVFRQGKIAGMSNDERKRRQIEVKRRRIIMLTLVVIVFALCWLPINTYHLLVDFKVTKHNFKIFVLVSIQLIVDNFIYSPYFKTWH